MIMIDIPMPKNCWTSCLIWDKCPYYQEATEDIPKKCPIKIENKMTNAEKLSTVFGITDLVEKCRCTDYDGMIDKCIKTGRCLQCRRWLDAEYIERNEVRR